MANSSFCYRMDRVYQWRRFPCSEWGGGGGRNRPLFWWAKAGNSSVASFLVWGGGQPPKCTDIKKNIYMHVTYMHERAKRAGASETYRPLFSHMVWRYKRQYRIKHWHWETLWINYASERAWKLFPFSHSKTAISFNILLVLLILYLRNTYIFRSQITSSYTYNQCSSLL